MSCRDRNQRPGYQEPHKWSEWKEETEKGIVFYTSGERSGHFVPFSITRTKRTCQECGAIERQPEATDVPPIRYLTP